MKNVKSRYRQINLRVVGSRLCRPGSRHFVFMRCKGEGGGGGASLCRAGDSQ